MRATRARLWARLAGAIAVVAGVSGSGAVASTTAAGASGGGLPSGVTVSTVAQAQPDECWVPPADPADPSDYGNYVQPTGHTSSGGVICPSGSQPKVNQAYVWGETHVGDHVFFGTAANVVCLVLGGYLGMTQPMEVPGSWTCEFGSSPTAAMGVPAAIGDWRPPQLFDYDMATDVGVNLLTEQSSADQATIAGLLGHTLGIRSAGEANNPLDPAQTVVFFAGPSLSTSGGINVFAFDQGGAFLGATTLPAYDDIRSWLTVPADSTGGQRLYTGVEQTAGKSGAILQWTPTAENLFGFTVVGTTPSEAAYLAAAPDRVFATTWPSGGHQAGLFVSPVSTDGSPDGALDGGAWTELWRAGDYEPDPLTAATYGGGALAVYDGYVYWGTMHVPFVATELHMQQYPPADQAATLADVLGTQRAVAIFRIPADGSGPAQLLYGDRKLPAYDPSTSSWKLADNNMGGVAGLYGLSGFGNPFDNYTWSMAVYDGQLYVGTMDWSYLIASGWPDLAAAFGLPSGTPNPFDLLSAGFGADLVRFPDASSPAQVVSVNGLGDPLSYGVRNMVSVMDRQGSENGLYLGMANPMNLATGGSTADTSPDANVVSPDTSVAGAGGWQLVKLTTGNEGQDLALDVTPPAQGGGTGSPVSVTAHLTAGGQPVGSTPVTFDVTSGPDAGTTTTVQTDATGTATLSLTATQAGTDDIHVSTSPLNAFGLPIALTGTATVTWSAPSVTVVTAPAAPSVTLSLSPASQSRAVNSSASVTALLTSNGQPVGSTPVTFTVVSGPDQGRTATAQTDVTGTAVFSLAGTQPGTDAIQASAAPAGTSTPATATASVVWVSLQPAISGSSGYVLAAADGGVFTYGGATFAGSAAGLPLAAPITGVARTPDGKGYWLVGRDGGVFAFGDAGYYGSAASQALAAPVVGIAPTTDGKGYWLVGADGGVFAFGDAHYLGSAAGLPLAAPVVGLMADPDGTGYWLVASDGGVFSFGSTFHGAASLPAGSIVGGAPTVDGGGYWLAGADGHVHPLGDAVGLGDPAGLHLARPVASIGTSTGGAGYVVAGSDGGVFAYGDAAFAGSAAGLPLAAPIVGIAAR